MIKGHQSFPVSLYAVVKRLQMNSYFPLLLIWETLEGQDKQTFVIYFEL